MYKCFLLLLIVLSPLFAKDPWKANAVVAISGDWAFVTDAKLADSLTNSKVAVYKRDNGVWQQRQTLTGMQLQPFIDKVGFGDAFGESISIDGDWAVIAAPLDSQIGRAMGAVYVFKKEGDVWYLKQTFYSDEPFLEDEPGHMLGCCNGVCVKGDKLFVGDSCHLGPNGEFHQGAVYVYQLKGKYWARTDTMYHPEGNAHDYFGVNFVKKDGRVVAGTMTDLDLKYPRYILPLDRDFVGTVPVIAENKTLSF